MAAPAYSEFKQKKQYGKGGARPSTRGTKASAGEKSPAMPYKCPSWGNSTATKDVGWGKDTKKCPTYPKSKGV